MVRIAYVGAAITALIAAPAAAQLTLQPGETLLEVQAEGQSRYLPDMANVSVGVVSTGSTAREATDANAKSMADVVAAVRRAGVDGRFIRTQQINVQPRFARQSPSDYEGQPVITGYVARNSVAVTILKLATAPDVIAAAFGAGANSVNGPNLGNREPATGVEQARADAITNARAEAETYAKAFGMRVARVLRVSERSNYTRSDEIVVSASRGYGLASPPPPPQMAPISGGEMTRTMTVWVDFALAR